MSNPPERLPSEPAARRYQVGAVEVRGTLTVRSGAVENGSGRRVVLERLAEQVAGDAAARRAFEASSLALTGLRHENLVSILWAARDSEGAYRVDGGPAVSTLNVVLARGGLRGEELLRIVRAVGAALVWCHQHGIVHGNVHPSSVLIDDAGKVRLSGFGLLGARRALDRSAASGSEPGPTEVTVQSYRLPEAGALDGIRLDLFDLGRLLYHLATGEPPESISMGLLPAWLHQLVRQALDPQEGERFQSVLELLELLERGVGDLSPAEEDSPAPTATRELGRVTEAAGAPEPAVVRPQGQTFPWMRAEDLYRSVGLAGKGGMGSVEEAIEISTGRRVAIKRLLRSVCAGSVIEERFHREAQHIARLSHPNILSLIQPARDERGDYLVLEWASGGSLQQRIKAHGPLSIADVLELARKIGSALAYAHQRGMIHRDVKPHNILYGGTGEPKLADFGLARFVDDQTLSSSRAGAGTPLYMAPEQRVDSTDVDARTDLYAFAKTLYFATTGGDPSVVDPTRLPRVLKGLLTECLSELPYNRPGSVVVFLERLERSVRRQRLRLFVPALLAVALLLLWALCRGDSAPTPLEVSPSDGAAAQALATAPDRVKPGAGPVPEEAVRPAPVALAAEEPSGPLALNIVEPSNGHVTSDATVPLKIEITSGKPDRVTCQGVELQPQEGHFVAAAIPLEREGANVLSVTVHGPDGASASSSVRIVRDTLGPNLVAADPPDGSRSLNLGQLDVTLRFDESVTFVSLAGRRLAIDRAHPEQARGWIQLSGDPAALPDLLNWTARDRLENETNGFLDYALATPRVPEGFRPLGKEVGAEGWARRVEHLASGIELVLIDPGTFWMGSPEDRGQEDEHPQHEMTIDRPFYLGVTEVTVGQWRRFARESGYLTEIERGLTRAMTLVVLERQGGIDWRESRDATWMQPFPDEELRSSLRYELTEQHPVTLVTWNDARSFCEHSGLELPTEAAWEYACRDGGPAGQVHWWGPKATGEGRGNFLDHEHFYGEEPFDKSPFSDLYPLTAPVGQFAASRFGLHDMAGNVTEWCRDEFSPYPKSSWRPAADVPKRAARGTSWEVASFKSSSANRAGFAPSKASPFLGFRVMRRM